MSSQTVIFMWRYSTFHVNDLPFYFFRISFDEVLKENVSFDPEDIYHTKALEDHEGLMEYLNSVVPTETTHNLMRVSEANHWNKNTIKGNKS